MIVYIDQRFHAWADWCRRRDDGGIGFPRQCSYTKLVQNHGARGGVEIDSEAWEIENAVQWLKVEHAALFDVVQVFYRRTMTVEQMAKQLGCCRDSVYAKLHSAHVKVMEWLQDRP